MSKKKIICLSPNKTPPVRSRANRYAWLLASVAAFALNIPAYANPEDGVVSAGSATITTTVKNVDIHQSSNRAIIDWRSFDIAPDETTRFHQPSASATTLNRVTGANPSTVAGNLQANGNVILINPNGVFFSKTAHVDVNGLVATTTNIDNSEFMAGSTTFDRPGNPNAAIVNQGRITAREAGLVGLVAPRVENSGTISARLGRVALSSGDTATIDLYGDGLVSVAVSDDVQHQLVRNSGTITAGGGTVQLSAAAGRQIVDSLIDVSGVIDAPTVATRQGRILIQADSSKTGSTALVSGSLNAAGRHAGEKGGQIDVLADNAGILSGATLDASGQAGGGTVHVGGDYQGQGALQRAQRSIVQTDTLIDVSAGEQGDGGRAIVWADQWTVFAGRILARGGRSGGNGGFVETSGKNTLTATGIVDAAAPFGVAGLWLLDPNNITIQTTGSNTNITGSPDFTTSNNSAILTVGSIQTALNAGTSVSVTTASAGTNTQLGDITVANSITKSSGGNASLTLTANRSIILNTGVSISSTSGQMGVTLNADSDANGTGSITLNSTSSILSNGGNIVLGGGANPLTTAARGYAGSVTGINLNAATINATGGNISLLGQGYAGTTNNYGILMQAGAKVMTSGTGTITMSGTGGVGTTGNRGLYLTGTGTAISSVDGAVTLTGQGGGTTTSNEGIYLAAAATIAATGSGAITLTGHAGGTTVQGVYLNQTTAANTIMSAGGTVTLKSNQTVQLVKAHIASPTAQAFNIVLNSDLDGNSSGRIALTTSNLLSSGGNITLGGGSNPATGNAFGVAGAVEGINLNASTLNAAGGNISLRGTGYTVAGVSNYGVYLQAAAKAQTSGSGTVTITGTGGAGTNTNYGVYLTGAGTTASTGDGALTLTGTARGSGTSNTGIVVGAGATVGASGTGTVSLTGQASTSATSSNRGLYLTGTGTAISSVDGAVTLTGQGGGTTTSNEGIYLAAAATIAATGSGAITLTGHAGGTTVQGVYLNQTTAANTIMSAGGTVTLKSNQTVQLVKAHIASPTAQLFNIVLNSDLDGNSSGRIALTTSNLLSSGGNITLGGGADPLTGNAFGVTGAVEGINLNASTLNAAGGNISLLGRGHAGTTNNYGIILQAAAKAQTSGSGTITMNGTGGVGTTGNRGIYLSGANTAVSSVNGAITLTGQGAGTTTTNEGIYLDTGATVASTGSGAITLTGHAGGTTVQGVYLNQTTAANTIMSAGGTVTLKSNQTVQLVKAHIASPTAQAFNIVLNSDLDGNSSGRIALTTSNLLSSGGNITLGGGSNPATGNAFGVAGAVEGINLNASTLNAAGGNISLRGTGYTVAGVSNYGVYLQAAAKAQTSGSGTVTITGTGGAGTNTNYGVYLTGAGTAVSSVDGAISLTGTAQGNGTSNTGIVIAAAATVGASGTGTVSLTGQASASATSSNRGIYLSGASTAVSSVSGGITLTGQGAGTTTTNEGIYLDTGATIASTGSGAITLTGHAGGTTVQGVYLNQTTAANTIMSAGGTVTLKSNQTVQLTKAHIASPTTQAFNIVLNSDLDGNSSGRIALTTSNLLSSGGTITLGGGSDPTTGSAFGVAGAVEGINLNASTLNAAGGNISLRGTGYTVAATNNYGIILQAAAKAQTSGSGTVTLTGTGGNGTTGNRGIYLTGAGSTASTVNGALTLTGTGAGTSSGYGIDISSSASVASTGAAALTLTGIGGTGAVGIYNSTTAATIGGASHTGNTVLTANNATWGSLAIQTTGSVTFQPYTASTTIGVAGGAGTLGITAAILGATNAGSLIIGRSDGSGLMTVNARTWTAPVSLYNGNANISLNGAQVMGARTFLARTYGTGDISIAAASTITSTATGNAIILASGHNFINAGGTSPLTAASGRWLIYSTNPASDTLGGLTSGFRRFSCSYGGSCPSIPASGNGFLYSYTPLLTITPTALSDITYGDATPNLTGYAYTVSSGYLGSDSGTDVLTGALTGATSYAPGSHVGTYNLNYASGSLASALGYGLTYANNASAFTVNKRVLTATLQNQTITYGTATPTLNKASTSDVVWGNLYGSDTGATLGSATFTYGGATPGSGNNAGSYTLGLSGITATNYSLGAVTNSTLTINPYTLTVAANSLSKVVGTPDPVLTYSYGTLQNGDSAAIFTGSLTRAPGDTIAGGPYAITQGTLAINSNYIMNFVAGQLVLTAAIPETVAHTTQPQLQFVTVETGSAVLAQLEPARIHVQLEDPALSGQPESSVKPAAGDEDSEEDDCASGATGTGNDTCR